MKGLLQYIKESNENNMYPTDKWMNDKFDEFNEKYFDNELSKCQLKVVKDFKIIDTNTFGLFHVDPFCISRRNIVNGMYKMYKYHGGNANDAIDDKNLIHHISELHPAIYLNGHIKCSENDMEDTFLHEMVHYWTHKDGFAPKQSHGKEFKRKCDVIRNKAKVIYNKTYELSTYGDFVHGGDADYDNALKVSADRKAKRQQKENENTVALYIKLPGSERFLFCKKDKVAEITSSIKYWESNNNLQCIIKSEGVYDLICKKYGRFMISTKYRFYFMNSYPEVKNIILNNGQVIFGLLDESLLFERKKHYIKPDVKVIIIDDTVNLSLEDIEDIEEINGDINDPEK